MKSASFIAMLLLLPMLLRAQEPVAAKGTGIDVPEEGIVLFEIPGVGSVDLIARFSGDTVYLPFRALCEFLSVGHRISDDFDTLSGELPAGTPFTIIRSSLAASYRGRSEPIVPSSVHVIDGEAYVERALLSNCYGLKLEFDSVAAVVRMPASLKVPIVARFRNSKRYAALAMAQEREDADILQAPIERQLLGSLALDWSIAGSYQSGGGPVAAGFFRAGGPLLFGVLDLNGTCSYNRLRPTPFSMAFGSWQWRFSLPDFAPLRRITFGGIAYGDHHRLMAELSNVPTSGHRYFSTHTITGNTPPGWMVELYDRTALLDVAQADSNGEYHFEVPIGYSPTTLTVQTLGPHGEQESAVWRLEVHHSQVPPGVLDYTARFSVDGLAPTAAADGLAMVRGGVAEWLTLGADLDLTSSSLRSIGIDSIAPTLHAIAWLGASAQLGVRYETRRKMFGGDLAYTLPGEASIRLAVDGYSPRERIISASGNAGLPLGSLALSLFSRYQKRPGRMSVEATPQVSAYIGGVGITAATNFLLIESDSARTELSAPLPRGLVSSSLRLSASLLQNLYLSGGATFDHRSGIVARASVASSYYLGHDIRVGVSYGVDSMKWGAGTLRSQISLSLFDRALYLSVGYSVPRMEWKRGGITADLRCDLGFGRLRNETIHGEGRTASTSSFDGGLVISPAGIAARNDPTVGRAAIVVRTFYDENANGVWDPDELELGDVRAVLRYRDMETWSENGEFYNVAPDETYVVTVDRWALADRELFPRRIAFPLYAAASTVQIVNVPFAAGFDAEGAGQVVLADGSVGGSRYTQALNALPVRLAAVDRSAEFDGEMFDDGSMMFVGVSAGEYRLEVSERVLAERGLRLRNPASTFVLGTTQRKIPPILFEMVRADRDGGR